MFALLLLACTPGTGLECSSSVHPDIATVARVHVHTTGGTVTVAYDAEGRRERTVTAPGGGEVVVDLHGMPADTDVRWRVTNEVGTRWSVCEGAQRTDPLPAELPTLERTVDAPGQSGDDFFLGAFYDPAAARPAIVILDRAGHIVWYTFGPEERLAIDVQRAIDGDTTDILYNVFDLFRRDDGAIRRVSLDGEVLREVPLPNGHHMFAQLPDGTLAWQALDIREATDPRTDEPGLFLGDAIVETAPDGTSRAVFSTWDWLPLEENTWWDAFNLYGFGTDWTHGNALKHDATTDRYLLSLGHLGAVLDIDRSSSTPIVATYGADGIAPDATSQVVTYQHDPSWTPDGTLLLFGTDPTSENAGAVEYEVADNALREVWRHGFDDVESLMLGQALRLENGNTIVNFGGGGVMREVTPAGEVVWEVAVTTPSARLAQFRPWSGF